MLVPLWSSPLAQRLVLFGAVVAAGVHGYIVAVVRVPLLRDFDVHREVGRRFLTGEYLYGGGFCYPYLPTAAMYFAPLALVDRGVGLAVRYGVAVISLYVTLLLLARMTRERSALTPGAGIWIGAATVLLAFQFILQDLDDGGPHLILLAILTAGIYCAWQGRDKLGAVWFGLAIALKVSPGLFLPFFLWKRQWRLAGFVALAATCWILLPIAWMGPGGWWNHQREWVSVAAGSSVGQDTTMTVQNEQRVRNQSLGQTLKRYLVTFPEDHPLRREDPGYVPILDLSPLTATIVIAAVTVGLLVMFGWYARRPFQGRGDLNWLRESSAVMILALLLSPVTWVQHLVWLIPALYLVLVDARNAERLPPLATAALAAYVLLADVLTYEVLGRRAFAFVLSYHPFTVAMLLVLVLLASSREAPPMPAAFRKPREIALESAADKAHC